MAENLDPKEVKLIEDYLRAAGLKGQDLLDRMDNIKKVSSEFNRELENAKSYFVSLNSEFSDLSQTFRNVVNDLNKSDDLSSRINKNFKTLGNFADKLKYDSEDISKLSLKELESLDKKIKIQVSSLTSQRQELADKFKGKSLDDIKSDSLQKQDKELAKQASQYLELNELLGIQNDKNKEGSNYLQKLIDLTQKRINEEKNLQRSIGLTGTTLKGLETITSKLGLSGLDDVFRDAKDAAEAKAKALGVSDTHALNLNGKFKVMGAALKEVGKGVISSLKDPLVLSGMLITAQISLLKKAYQSYSEIEERIISQRRQLALNHEESKKIYNSSLDFAISQKDGFTTTTRLFEARQKINDTLGTSIILSNQEAQTAAKLTYFYGINEEQNANIYKISKQLGVTNNDVLNTVLKTSTIQKAQFGGTLSYQDVLKKVSGVSGEILTKFKGNVGALTEAVMQADRLGLTLEQVDKVGESLLNFESSIENELKAELLTGKAINLERARSAALSGDTAKLMTEIKNQVGNIHQFEKMNVIQRKAYAEAFGMTASEMGDMLRKQEFEAKLAGSGAKSAQDKLDYAKKHNIAIADSIKKDLESQSLAELQKTTFQNINDLIAKLTSGPMEKLVHMLEKGLHFVQKILEGFSKLTGGKLGDALGAAILGAPLLIGAIMAVRSVMGLFAGGMKNILRPRPSGFPGDQIHVIVDGSVQGTGTGGGMGPIVPDTGSGKGKTTTAKPTGGRFGKFGKFLGTAGRSIGLGALAYTAYSMLSSSGTPDINQTGPIQPEIPEGENLNKADALRGSPYYQQSAVQVPTPQQPTTNGGGIGLGSMALMAAPMLMEGGFFRKGQTSATQQTPTTQQIQKVQSSLNPQQLELFNSLRQTNIPANEALAQARASKVGMGTKVLKSLGGLKGFGVGLGLGIVGDVITSKAEKMESGAGKTAMTAGGYAATGAGMGLMFGPIGAGIGALAGAVYGLVQSNKEEREQKKMEEEKQKEQFAANNKRTEELMQALTARPIHLNVGGKTILEYNEASVMYGNQNNFLAK